MKRELSTKYGRLDAALQRKATRLPAIGRGGRAQEAARSQSLDPGARYGRSQGKVKLTKAGAATKMGQRPAVLGGSALNGASLSYGELQDLNLNVQAPASGLARNKPGLLELSELNYGSASPHRDGTSSAIYARAGSDEDEASLPRVALRTQPDDADAKYTELEINRLSEQIKQMDQALHQSEGLLQAVNKSLGDDMAGNENLYISGRQST